MIAQRIAVSFNHFDLGRCIEEKLTKTAKPKAN